MKHRGDNKKQSISLVLVLAVFLSAFPLLALGDWSDWWSTPEQQALKLYESGDHQALLEHSPNANWTALGQFQSEDYSAASTSFAKSREALIANSESSAATAALYNKALSDVLTGDYEQAIEQFNEVLSENPEFVDAAHNLDIAKQLLDLQEKQENSQDQNGEQGEDSDQNSDSSESDQSSENSDSESSDSSSDESSDSDSSSESEEDPSSSGDESSEESKADSATEEQQQQEEQDARDALAAEALQEQLEGAEDLEQMAEQAIESDEPLSESEQATEQILRRIPDDPRGLLRRKLEQSHLNEFPEVRDALEPW